ncbi:exosome complex component RRP43-like [Leptopilina boulardi]|uniref:exosome complex component RRP43-like n=1 Tax=Leptopilina boulardi TaxID=63433 RepID=UPI0021F58D7B|nr:exosome complex component RRP43-like [Leptopilina boulardi]
MDSQFKTIHPVKYLRDHFAQEIRPDGRDFVSFRPVSINVSSIKQADSSCVFKIGNTTVICGIKAELCTPKASTPDCGFAIVNVNLPPLCSPKFRPGPPSEEAQCATKIVDEILSNSAILDLKDLCICKDKLAWVLYCDLVCIDFDGSVIDVCIGALMAALETLTLPEVTYDTETKVIVTNAEKRIPLPLKPITVSLTFASFDERILIVDPTEDEENLSHSKITIAVNANDMCFVQKTGGAPMADKLITKSIAMAKKRAEAIRKLIETATSSHKVT